MKGIFIQLIEIKSNEEISKNYIDKFILNEFIQKDLDYDSKSFVYYSFIQSFKSYQIIHFKNSIPDIFYFETLFQNSLIVINNLACVYKNKKLYYCQKIDEEISLDELKIFLEKSLCLKDLQIEKKIKKMKNHNYNFIKLKKTNILKYFISYLFLLCSLFYYVDFDNSIKDKEIFENIKNKTNVIKNSLDFKYLSSSIVELFLLSKENRVSIEKLELKKSIINLTIHGIDKKDIYTFFEKLKNIKIEDISYDKNLKVHIVNAIYKIYRK